MEKLERRQNFIDRAKIIHKDENLDYSEVEYVNNRTLVKIIDHDLRSDGTEYGEFWQSPSNHLKGQSHPDKRGLKLSKSKRDEQDDVIRRFKEIHKNENLDYSEVEYVNMHTKVKIIDHDLRPDGTEFGEFWQEPVVHLKGCGHPDKGILKYSEAKRHTQEQFLEICKKIHYKDNYSYDLVEYKGNDVKISIICNKKYRNGDIHGLFRITPGNLIQGKGCPICGHHLSKSEGEIVDYIRSLIPDIQIIQRDKSILEGKELDIYLPDYKLAIEYDGLRWHTEKFNKDKNYHLNKTLKCKEKGITLIHIFEDEYMKSKNLVFDKIKSILGFNRSLPKVDGRKCLIEQINSNSEDIKKFLNENHIQGYVGSTIAYGAYYENKLYAVMTFKREGDVYELNRFCSDINYRIPGVASKIFKRFINENKPKEVKSFLDRRWCFNEDDNLYIRLGFVLDKVLRPDYRYSNGFDREHKFGFRKQKLHKLYGFPLSMTESEMTEELGYYKIYDCGLLRYKWKGSE